MSASDRIEMTSDDAGAVLIINDTVPKDTQAYRIEATNKLGRVQATCKLTVQCKDRSHQTNPIKLGYKLCCIVEFHNRFLLCYAML